MSARTLILMWVLGLMWPALARAEDEGVPPLIGDVTNGAKLYSVHCAVCHGFDGSGEGPARAKLKARPVDHRDGSVMNGLDNGMLFRVIQSGCKVSGCSASMPAFSKLDALEVWDLVSFLRSLHLPLAFFFPAVDQYVVKRYTIGALGNDEFKAGQMERLKQFLGKWDQADLERTTYTLFRADRRRSSPELVPQEPRRLADLVKDNKLGYVFFMQFTDPRGARVPVGLALDKDFTITKLVSAVSDPGKAGEYNSRLAGYVGLGRRGDKPEFKLAKDKKDKLGAAFDEVVVRLYVLAVEAANAFELEEKERSWADGTF